MQGEIDRQIDRAVCEVGSCAAVTLRQAVFARMYRRAPSVDALPWHRESPPALLVQAAAGRRRGDRCLDVGCGEGVNATYLAE